MKNDNKESTKKTGKKKTTGKKTTAKKTAAKKTAAKKTNVKKEKEVMIPAAGEAMGYTRKRRSFLEMQKEPTTIEIKMGDVVDLCDHPEAPTPVTLINEISKLFINYVRERGAGSAMSGSYRHLIYHLAIMDGRTQLELSRLTHLKPPTVSLSLAKLEAEGYVRREVDTKDLRQTRVFLTDKGREVDELARKYFRETEELITGVLTEEEKQVILELLMKIRNIFETL